MLSHVLAIVGLALLAGAWVLVQSWIAHHDPEAPGVEGGCHGCRGGCERPESCEAPRPLGGRSGSPDRLRA